MRVLFNIAPCTSHVHPVVPLAQALQSAGHEVRISTDKANSGVDSSHAIEFDQTDMGATISATGLTAVPLAWREQGRTAYVADLDLDVLAQPIDEQSWRGVRDQLLAIFSLSFPTDPADPGRSPVLDDLVDFARAWTPDLVLWDIVAPAASIAARVSGATHLRLVFAQDKVALIDQRQPDDDDRFRRFLEPMAERHGLGYSKELLFGQRSIDMRPIRHWQPPGIGYVPMRRVSYTGATSLPTWLYDPPKRPRVCLTLGWSIFENLKHTLSAADIAKVASALDVEMVVTIDPGELVDADSLPDNVRAVGYVPLDLLLPTCSAIVHHGGSGTEAAAVAHRVPQVIVPVPRWDGVADARYIEDHGAGLTLAPEEFSAEELRGRLARVLGDASFQAGATALHTHSLAAPGPVDMVPILERLAT